MHIYLFVRANFRFVNNLQLPKDVPLNLVKYFCEDVDGGPDIRSQAGFCNKAKASMVKRDKY